MALPDPVTREDNYLGVIAGQETAVLPEYPITRSEKYLAKIAGQEVATDEPITREDNYLDYIAEHGMGAEVEPLAVNANGEYTAPEGKAYSPVTVNVPPTPMTQVGTTLYIGQEDSNG